MRISPDLREEDVLWQAGVFPVAGLDEAGRGAWAGPVAAAAVILPKSESILAQLHGVRDSKQMTAAQRSFWAPAIKNKALAWGIGMASQTEIDEMGILPATRLAMMRAIEQLTVSPAHLMIDAVRLLESPLPQTALIKGDARSLSIAAASVLAKTSRDEYMMAVDTDFPGYQFAQHKGYGTRMHQKALELLGACTLHRFSFSPLQNIQRIHEA